MADARGAGSVGVTRERMQDQDGVGSGLVQLTPRLVGDRDLRQAATRLEGNPAPPPSAITAN